MSYEEFKEFHDKHPDLDNVEYYAEFPETNKSTVRSWKSRSNKIVEPQAPPTPPPEAIPDPTPEQVEQGKGYEELVIDSLCDLTRTSKKSLRGMTVKAQIQFLKNKRDDLGKEPQSDRTSNGSILPSPKPVGSSAKRFGIDDYITFDGDKNEIRMEIPMTVLFDPDQNRGLGERK